MLLHSHLDHGFKLTTTPRVTKSSIQLQRSIETKFWPAIRLANHNAVLDL